MAAVDASWGGLVWWSWPLVGITILLLAAAVAIAVVQSRKDRARVAKRRPGISFYLDDGLVMNLYRQYGGKYRAALSMQVWERITSSNVLEGSVDIAQVKASGKRGVDSDVFRSYIEQKNEAITVIGIVIDVLDQEDDIVDVDLLKEEVTANNALDKALGIAGKRPTAVPLRRLKTFVSISGDFHETAESTSAPNTSEIRTFEAPYGDPTELGNSRQVHRSPHVFLECMTSGLSDTAVPSGTFPARCLGLVESWDPGTLRLNVRPIAIFL